MAEPRIRIFLDDKPEPITDYRPPAEVALDTSPLPDGEHRLRIEAVDTNGNIGVRTVPFVVRNGPGITLSGAFFLGGLDWRRKRRTSAIKD